MRKLLFITFFLCFSSIAAFSQTDDRQLDEGTVYSQFGVGFPVDLSSSSADGIGLWGVSFAEPGVPSIANPAQWGSTIYGMATGGVGIDNFNAKDNFGSARNSLLSVKQFQLQLPLYKNKLGVSLSFSPYSRAAYQVRESGSRVIGSGATQETINFQSQTTGSGGVNRFELGFGWKINSNISIGYAASLMFASIDNDFQTTIDNDDTDEDSPFQPVNFTLQTSGSGFGNRVGVYFTLPDLTEDGARLNIGTTVNFPVKLSGERTEENNRIDDDIRLAEGAIQLPLGVKAGVSYFTSNKFSVTTEALYQKWSNYENELNSGNEGVFTDRLKIGAGARYFPFVSNSDRFLSQFKYRLGASYDSGHLKLNGENISTIMFSAGLGLLSPNSNSTIDLSFEYGFRGTKSQNLVKENIWGIELSLNLSEIFFFRPKLQ